MRPAIWSSPRTKFRVSRADNAGFHVYKSKREARLKLEVRNRRRAPLHHDRLIKVKIWGDMLVYPGKKAACANADRDGYGSPSGYRAEHMEVLT
jgi:hypothetical protein